MSLFNVEIENSTSTYNSTTDATLKNDTNDTSKTPSNDTRDIADENEPPREIKIRIDRFRKSPRKKSA